MILEQNYIRISEYSHKTLKKYCKRQLGIMMIKLIKKKMMHSRLKTIEQPEQLLAVNYNKVISQKSIGNYSAICEQTQKADSIGPQLNKSRAVNDRYDNNNDNIIIHKSLLKYGDVTMIYSEDPRNNRKMVMKCLLERIKIDYIQHTSPGNQSKTKSMFKIINPNNKLKNSQAYLTQNSVVLLYNVSKGLYLRSTNRMFPSGQFAMVVGLSRVIDQNCMFQMKNKIKTNQQCQLYTDKQIYIKKLDNQKYLGYSLKAYENQIILGIIPSIFMIKRTDQICHSKTNSLIRYFQIKNIATQTYLSCKEPNSDSFLAFKTYTRSYFVNHKRVTTPIQPIFCIQANNKYVEDAYFLMQKQSTFNALSIWQLIPYENNGNNQNNIYHLYNPILKLGVQYKIGGSTSLKLVSSIEQFSKFRIYSSNTNVDFITQDGMHCLNVSLNNKEYQNFELQILNRKQCSNHYLFNLVEISPKIVSTLNQLFEIQQALIVAISFFNIWGYQINEKSETLVFNTNQTEANFSEPQDKIKQMNAILKKIITYFVHSPLLIKEIHQLLHALKIFEILIGLSKILLQKIEIPKFYEKQDQRDQIFISLEELLIQILLALKMMVVNNKINSAIVVSEVIFFSKLLLLYSDDIRQILLESIKNLSLFAIPNSNNWNELFLWAKLIVTVRYDTIMVQKTYIDIISEVVIDPEDKGIVPYQNKCKQLLFVQGSSKKKGIPKFGFNQSLKKITIMFDSESSINQFLGNNEELSKIVSINENPPCFHIDNFFVQKYHPSRILYDQYINYICSIIRLFRNLCKNRNKKLIKIINDWGITYIHIISAIHSKRITWQLKALYLDLYYVMYIDQDPFLSFSKRQSKCHCWQSIKNYNIFVEPTALVFRQYTNYSMALTKLHQFNHKVIPVIYAFFRDYLRKFPNFFYDKSQLDCFERILKIIKLTMNLGFFTLKQMKDFIAIILKMLGDFYTFALKKRKPAHDLLKIHSRIFKIFIDIVVISENIWIQISGILFLQNFHKAFATKAYTQQWSQHQKEWQKILMNKFQLPNESILVQQETERRRKSHFYPILEQQGNYDIVNNTENLKIQPVIKMAQQKQFHQIDEELQSFLVLLLCKRNLKIDQYVVESVLKLIEKKINRAQSITQYLKNIMIINNKEEQTIYRNFNGRQLDKLLNWLKIQQLVAKIEEEQECLNPDIQNQKRKKQKILELNNIMLKIIRQLKNYKNRSLQELKKSQEILEKFNVHKVLLCILRFSSKRIYRQVIQSILDFLLKFIDQNQKNCKLLSQELPTLSKNIKFDAYNKLIPQLYIYSTNKGQIFRNIIDCMEAENQKDKNLCMEILCSLLKLSKDQATIHYLRNQFVNKFIKQMDTKQLTYSNFSLQYGKLLCKLAEISNLVKEKIMSKFTKWQLIKKIREVNEYSTKKYYLLILIQIYIKGRQIQNFEIEDLVKELFLPEITKIPNVCMKMMNRQQNDLEKQAKISQLFQDFTTLHFFPEQQKIEASVEQSYLDYLLDSKHHQDSSLFVLMNLIIKQWENGKKGRAITVDGSVFRIIEEMIFLAFSDQNCLYYHQIIHQIQVFNLNLALITLSENRFNNYHQVTQFSENKKRQIIKLYSDIAEIIVNENLSLNYLIKIFHGDLQELLLRRLGQNHKTLLIDEEKFRESFQKIKKYLTSENIQILEASEMFILIASCTNSDKLIDVYAFLEKLLSILQSLRYTRIRKQIHQFCNIDMREYNSQQFSMQVNQNIEEYYKLHMNNYKQTKKATQVAFKQQVQVFCKIGCGSYISKLILKRIIHKIDEKISKNMKEKNQITVRQSITSQKYSIVLLHPKFQYQFMYSFSLSILSKLDTFKIPQQLASALQHYLQTLLLSTFTNNNDVSSKNQKFAFLQFLKKINVQFSNCLEMINILEDKGMKAYKAVMRLIRKTDLIQSHVLYKLLALCQSGLIQLFKSKYITLQFSAILQKNLIQDIIYMIESIKKVEQNSDCSWNYNVLHVLLKIWYTNQTRNKQDSFELLKNPIFISWVKNLYEQKNFSKSFNRNSSGILRLNLTNQISRILVEYSENLKNIYNFDSQKIIKMSKNHLEQLITSKKEVYSDLDYCARLQSCSPYFCNNNKIISHDFLVIQLILQVMILVRIQNKELKSCKDQPDNLMKFYAMIGSIEYRMPNSNLIKTKYFRLPYLSNYFQGNVKDHMESQIQKISPNQISSYMPMLTILFQNLLTSNAKFHRYFISRCLIKHKNLINLFILALSLILSIDQINRYPQDKSATFATLTVLIVILVGFYLIVETKFIIIKINYYIQVKSSKQKHIGIALTQKSKKLSVWYGFSSTIKIIWVFFFRTFLFFHYIAIIMYLGSSLFGFVAYIFTISSVRKRLYFLIKSSFKTLLKVLILILMVTLIASLSSFLMLQEKQRQIYPTYSSYIAQLIQQLLSLSLFGAKISASDHQDIFSHHIPIFVVFLLLLGISFLLILFVAIRAGLLSSIYNSNLKNKCLLCKKSYFELLKQGKQFGSHTKEQHNIWNYLYFFQILQESKQSHLNTELQSMVSRSDYTFLNLSEPKAY